MTTRTDLAAYRDFIAAKAITTQDAGIAGAALSPCLKAHQVAAVEFALRKGRSALFLDTGLGKTLCELEFARQVADHTGKPSLILAPLAVAGQIVREGAKFGIEATQVREQADVPAGNPVVVSNYERLDKLDPRAFGGVALDESSILKAFTGTTKRALVAAFADTPFRLAATATPAPNDHMELGQHAEFLGIMPGPEMLSRWFINDTSTMGGYRLKGHAREDFWSWIASWSRCATLPSDLGGCDYGYVLPEVDRRLHLVERDLLDGAEAGDLYARPVPSATTFHAEKRMTLDARCSMAARLANHDRPVTVWCERNDESAMLADMIEGAVEVKGSDSADVKEAALLGFAEGRIRALVTKPSLAGFGMNFQHCAHAVFASLSFSYEQHYQAVRRSHRFGQTETVVNDIVMAATEKSIWDALNGKAEAHAEMKRQMSRAMVRAQAGRELRVGYGAPSIHIPSFLATPTEIPA